MKFKIEGIIEIESDKYDEYYGDVDALQEYLSDCITADFPGELKELTLTDITTR